MKMIIPKLVIVSLCLSSTIALAAATPPSSNEPDPSQISVLKVINGGQGCPQGSTPTATFDERRTTLTLAYDSFTAKADGPLSQRRMQCRITLDLEYPEGFEIAITHIETSYTPVVSAESTKFRFEIESGYYFQGDSQQGLVTKSINSVEPLPGAAHKSESKNTNISKKSSELWSGCGPRRALNIILGVRSLESSSPSKDHIIFESPATLAVKWRRCTKK